MKCINKPLKVTKTGRKPPVLLTSAKSNSCLFDVFDSSGRRRGVSESTVERSRFDLGSEDVLGVKREGRAGIPISFGSLPLTAPLRKQVPGHPFLQRRSFFPVVWICRSQRSKMACIPSGQFLHLPSPSCSNLVVKVLVVSRTIFLLLGTHTCFFGMWGATCKYKPLGLR